MNRKILSVLVLLITAINFAAFSQETGSADELYTSHPNVFHLSFDSDFIFSTAVLCAFSIRTGFIATLLLA